MFLNQSGSDVISTPLLATFSKLSASLHTHYFVVGGKLHFAKFSYIIRGVSAGTNAFVLARKSFLINKRQVTFSFHLYLGTYQTKPLDTSKN